MTGKPAHAKKVVIKCFTNVFATINISMLFLLPSAGSSHNIFYLERQNVNNLHNIPYNEQSGKNNTRKVNEILMLKESSPTN